MRGTAKKVISLMLTLAMVLTIMPIELVGATASPNIALSASAVDVSGGDATVTVQMSIANNPGFGGMQMNIGLPVGWTITKFEYRTKTEYSVLYAEDEYGDMALVARAEANPKEKTFAISHTSNIVANGTLCWITISVPKDTLNDSYEVEIIPQKINDAIDTATNQKEQFVLTHGTITVTGGLNKDDLKPTITTQPVSASYVYDSGIDALSVAATVPTICEGLTYQWYKDGQKIDGETEATYQPRQIYGTTAYYCEVTTTYQDQPFSTASEVAQITYSKAALPKDRFLLEEDSFVYDGTEKSPAVSTFGAAGQKPLEPNVDWRIVRTCQSSATEAGTYTISIEGLGNYEGTIDWTWTIERAGVDAPVAEEDLIYNGMVQTGVPEGEGYTITGNTQKNAGSYTAVAVLDSNHKWADGTTANKNISWTIAPKTVQAVWSNTELTYNGKTQAPTATVDTGIAGETLVVNVTGGQKNVGENYTATASIINKNYALDQGSATTPFAIAPKDVDVVWTNTTLTYNGKEQAPTATVDTGIAGETLTPAVTGAKKNAGSYTATAAIDNANYALGNTTTNFTIKANAQFTDVTAKEQNVVVEVGSFAEPKFTGVDSETVTGITTYTYKGESKTAAEINAALQTLAVNEEVEIAYSFAADGNYSGTKIGTIKVKMVSIIYEVGGAAATINNAVTIKADATYGDDWSDIVKINAIAASVNGVPVAGQYKLDVTGKPNAGRQIPFKVLFTADSDARYQNVEVVSGTVAVASKKVAVEWGSTALTYNGQKQVPAASAKGVDNAAIVLNVTGGQTNAGQGYEAVAATADTNYQLTGATKAFAIAPKSVAVQWTNTELTYNGKEQAPAAVALGVGDYVIPLTMTTDKQTNVGEYTAAVTTADGNYALTGVSKAFAIKALTLKAADLEIAAIAEQTYAGVAIKPAVSVSHKVTGEQLDSNDLTITYKNNTNAGTAKVDIAGQGNYTGTLTDAASFTIAPKSVDVVWANTTLTYSGKEQAPTATVDTGIAGETLTPTVTGAKKNAGSYTVTAAIDNANYALGNTTTNFTIKANAQFTDVTAKEQNVVVTEGSFAEPKFTGIDGETVTGITTYTYKGESKTAAEINAALQTLAADTAVEIAYSFVADGNYSGTKTGTIKVKMVSIIYEVGGAAATINNAVTIKADATYGDDWSDIVKINAIAASVNGVPVAGQYKLDVTGKPNAGQQIPFKVLFTATSDSRYQNVEVVSGTVDVAAKKVAVEWTNTSLIYNGQEQVPAASAKGVDNTNVALIVTGAQTNVGEGYTATASTEDANYELTGNTTTFAITAAQMDATVTVEANSNSIIKDTVLTANVTGKYDVLAYQWLKDGNIIEGATAQSYTIGDGMAGSFISVQVTSSGNYVGTATSTGTEVGKIILTATVTIAGETAVGSELTATVIGECDFDIVWLADGVLIENASGSPYIVVKADQGKAITAKIVGKGDYTGEAVSNGIAIPAGRPDVVVLTAAAGSKKVTLNWAAPADNGAAITGYQVKVDGEGQEWIDVAADQTSYVFTELQNGTEYTFYIKAVNAAGESEQASVVAKPKSTAISGGVIRPTEPEQPKDIVTTHTDASGNKVTTTEKVDGSVEIKAELNDKAVANAVKNDTAVQLPMNPVTVGAKETEVTINTGAKETVKVEIPVAETTSGTVVVLVKTDGTEQIVRDSVVTESGVVANVSDGDKIVIKDNSKEFKDVADHWGKDAINFVAARGIFAGTGDGSTFSPDVATTRGMIAQVLHNLEYNEEHPNDGHSFPDVGEHHWYDDAVHWAEDHGIVGGYGDGTFKGDKEVTREELVVMLWNYAGKQTAKNNSLVNGFNDAANVSDWAKTAMNWALENGVLGGKGGKMLDPTGFATRAELAQMMKNYLENV